MDPRSGLFYAALKDDAMASPRVRLRMRRSSSRGTASAAKSSSSRRLLRGVQRAMRLDNIRDAFKHNAQLAARIALGVLIAGVAQTRSSGQTSKQWALLPADYFLGGLSWAALMVIFAAARTVGGALMQIWQIDLGVALALLYNVVVYSLIPMHQQHLVTVSVNLNGNSYDISLTDWAKIVPLLLFFTFVVFVLPIVRNSLMRQRVLTVVSPMNPIYPMQRKDIGDGFFNVTNLQFIHLIGSLINNLDAMTFAIELETCHSAHTTLMERIQRKVYVLQTETNDLLDDIATHVLDAATTLPTQKLRRLETRLERLIKAYTETYSSLLTTQIQTPQQVGRSMPLNLFLYSFHALIQTLVQFENAFNQKNFTLRHRISGFLRHVVKSLWQKEQYPRQLLVFALRTTFAVFIGVCLSTFVFAFSSTVPNAIAMVAEAHIGGTYGNTANRLSGLVAGTVLPSIFSFFICKSRSAEVYNTVNNVVLFGWTTLSMYVFYSSRYFQSAGMVSAYMAASVLLEHNEFATFDAEDTAIFMQMKEAFRVADVHRRGQVDATELAVLLEQLMPYSMPEGTVKMDQYVTEFMQLVDRNHDGIITYAEFMDALNHGFRLELEIYNDIRVKSTVFRQSSREGGTSLKTESGDGGLFEEHIDDNGEATAKGTASVESSRPSVFKTLWSSATKFMGNGVWGHPEPSPSDSPSPRQPSITLPIGQRDTLLAVESFSIKDAAAALREHYGTYLLEETAARHIAVEDFILMSCLVCATEEIASQLMLLNRLAAT
ncbi:hypothetical protein ATCC90586_007543 [Pythium insidiosum]|nr:hypothetical protein ATCC90586_007543 [Pythium insidiosum]